MDNKKYREKLEKEILFSEEAVDILEISKQAFSKHVKNERIFPIRRTVRSAIYLKDDVLKLKEELKSGRMKYAPYLFDSDNEKRKKEKD